MNPLCTSALFRLTVTNQASFLQQQLVHHRNHLAEGPYVKIVNVFDLTLSGNRQ